MTSNKKLSRLSLTPKEKSYASETLAHFNPQEDTRAAATTRQESRRFKDILAVVARELGRGSGQRNKGIP